MNIIIKDQTGTEHREEIDEDMDDFTEVSQAIENYFDDTVGSIEDLHGTKLEITFESV